MVVMHSMQTSRVITFDSFKPLLRMSVRCYVITAERKREGGGSPASRKVSTV